MLLRALLSGNVVLFEEALAEFRPCRSTGWHSSARQIAAGFRALYRKAALPEIAYPAFRAGLAALRDGFASASRAALRGSSAAWSSACSMSAARRAATPTCLPCCAALQSKPRAKKRGCSATNWWPIVAPVRDRAASTKRDWRPEAAFQENARAAAILMFALARSGRPRFSGEQEFVRHFAQAAGQHAPPVLRVRAGIFAVDRAHGVDVLFDQQQRVCGSRSACTRSAGKGCRRPTPTAG